MLKQIYYKAFCLHLLHLDVISRNRALRCLADFWGSSGQEERLGFKSLSSAAKGVKAKYFDKLGNFSKRRLETTFCQLLSCS